MNVLSPCTRHVLGTRDAKPGEQQENPPRFALASKCHRAIDLSCRACGAGAGCWAWIPGRGNLRFYTPNLRFLNLGMACPKSEKAPRTPPAETRLTAYRLPMAIVRIDSNHNPVHSNPHPHHPNHFDSSCNSPCESDHSGHRLDHSDDNSDEPGHLDHNSDGFMAAT